MKSYCKSRALPPLAVLAVIATLPLATCLAPQPAAAAGPASMSEDASEYFAPGGAAEAASDLGHMLEVDDAPNASEAPLGSGGPWPALPFGLLPFAVGMVALGKDRDTPKRDGKLLPYPVGAGRKIYAGSLVVLDAGYARPGAVGLNLIAVGRANEFVDNTGGADGDLTVLVERGVFRFAHDGSITQADVGRKAYIVDDQTVADTDGAGTRSEAGTIRGVEAGGVWIEI